MSKSNNTNSKLQSEQDHEGKRAATRQYMEYGEEPRSAADKGIVLKATWNNIVHDLRPLVLLALGVLIVLGHYLYCKAMSFSCSDSVKLLHIKSFSWQEDGLFSQGFYLQPSTAQQTEKEMPQITSYHPRLAPLFFLPIPINTCDEELLITIPGIGPTLARRIMDFRQQFGAIQNEEDLLRIKGIGPAKLKELTRAINFQ